MKKRTISAIVALLIFIPIFIKGGFIFNAAIYILSMLGLKEFLDIKSIKKDLPAFISFISYIIMSLIVLFNTSGDTSVFKMDFRIIAGLFLVFLIPTVLYHDKEKYSINDAFFLIGGIFFLGSSFSLMIIIRDLSLNLIIYLFLITVITDSYAYLIGSLIGRHKLLESISPKKTMEGLVAGALAGTIIPAVFYLTVIDSTVPVYIILLVTLFLSVLGEFGDLFFSAIKRYFGKKDFSNLMPGHGGILDRFDSIIFVILGFIFFISII